MQSFAVSIRDHRPGEFLSKSVFSGMESPEIQLILDRLDTGAIRNQPAFADRL
jgi:hypothetical protein